MQEKAIVRAASLGVEIDPVTGQPGPQVHIIQGQIIRYATGDVSGAGPNRSIRIGARAQYPEGSGKVIETTQPVQVGSPLP